MSSTFSTTKFLEKYKSVFDELPIGIIIVNDAGKIIYQNLCLTSLLGDYAAKEVDQLLPGFPKHLFTADHSVFPYSFASVVKSTMANQMHVQCRIKKNQDNNLLVTIADVNIHLEQIEATEKRKNAAENLLRSAVIGQGSLEDALLEICRIAAESMEVTRVNIWEFGEDQSSITSLINFDNRVEGVLDNVTLYRYQIPNYFRLFETEEIIPTTDAVNDPNTAELKTSYIEAHGIISLIDVPIRISGKMFGLVCFEDTMSSREWDSGEQKLGLFIAQVIALTIETSRRKKTQKELELILDEKRILLNEIHRRVRNNFSLIQDLIRTESKRAQDDFHRDLFKDLRNRINSLDMLQRQLYQSEKVDRINFRDLVIDLVAGYRATFAGRNTDFVTTLDQCELNVAKASISGLLLNEITMLFLSENSHTEKKETISIRLKKINTHVRLSIVSSIIIDKEKEREKMLTSFEMAEKLGSKLEINRQNGTSYEISFES